MIEDLALKLLLFLAFFSYLIFGHRYNGQISFKDCPDCDRNVSQLISSKGFPVENHWVTTDDGYILSLIRIPGGKNVRATKGVVFLQHGLLDSACTWVILQANESLGYILADNGYDVWLGNSRGNTYSNSAVNMTINDAAFWAFSWDEMAKYDLPAMLNYAMKISNVSNLFYIGHSQGTIEAFAGLGTNQDLASKVKLFVALGPAAYVGHSSSTFINILAYLHTEIIFEIFGINEFLPNSAIFKTLGIDCTLLPFICDDFLFLIVGWDRNDLNNSNLPNFIAHTPAGTSVQNMAHWAQLDRSDAFQMYDYGYNGNMKHYNQPTPPFYHLSNVHVPVAAFYGSNDALTDPTDVKQMLTEIPNVVYSEEINGFNHLDYIWDDAAATIIYPKILQLLQKYQ